MTIYSIIFIAGETSSDRNVIGSDLCYSLARGEVSWTEIETRLSVPALGIKSSIINQTWILSGAKDVNTNEQVIQIFNGETYTTSLGMPPSDLNIDHCQAKIDDHTIFFAPIFIERLNRHFVLDLEDYNNPKFVFQEQFNLPYSNDTYVHGQGRENEGDCGVAKNADQESIIVILLGQTSFQTQNTYVYNVPRNEFSSGPTLPFDVYYDFSTLSYEDTFLMFGGLKGDSGGLLSAKEIFVYNAIMNTFEMLASKMTYAIVFPIGVLVPRDFTNCPGEWFLF